MVLFLFALFRAGFEPLSWRSDHGPSLRIEGRSVFLGGITSHAAAQNRRGMAWQRNQTLDAPSFSPYRSRVPAPFRPTRHTSPLDRLPNARYIAEARERFTLPRS